MGSPEMLTVLEGSWDVLITYNWASSPTYSLPEWPYVGCQNYKYFSSLSSM